MIQASQTENVNDEKSEDRFTRIERDSMRKLNRLALLALIDLLLVARLAHAGGIEVPMQSARAAGEADAFTAQADDPSAIFYNPAGLTQLHGTQGSVGAYYLQPEFEFHSAAGQEQDMHLPSVLPHFYIESDLGTDRLRVGLGANDAFGINEHWGNNGPLSTILNRGSLEVLNFAPSIALRVTDKFSIGADLNVYYGDLNLQRNVILAAPPAPEGNFQLKGYDTAVGATVGMMYKIDSRNQIGAYYRSPFALNFGGHAQVTSSIIPEIGPSHTNESLDFPQSIGVGYAIKPILPLTVEGDVIWTDWHSLDQLKINSPNAAFNGQTIKADWDSGFTFRLGGEYRLDQHWSLRAGYAYSDNAVPGSTFGPIVPDNSYNLVALGVGYSTDHWGLDLAMNYINRGVRHITDSVNSPNVNGNWDNQMYGMMLTFTYKM
jgi:long-chain fatty acid transport protein